MYVGFKSFLFILVLEEVAETVVLFRCQLMLGEIDAGCHFDDALRVFLEG